MSVNNVNGNIQAQGALNFQETVNQSQNDGQYIYVKGGQIKQEGSFSHLFTLKSTNIATTQALQNEVLSKFGQDAANALAPKFAQFIRSGKQLTVGMTKELLAEAKRLQENSAVLRQTQAAIQELGPLIANAMSSKIDAMVLEGVPHGQASEILLAEANVLKTDLDNLHQMVDQIIEQNPKWDTETRNLFKDTFDAFLTEKPWNIDQNSTDVAVFLEKIPKIINNELGMGDVFTLVNDSAQKRDLLQMIASVNLHQPGSCEQALLVKILPEIRKAQPEGIIRAETIYAAASGKEAPGNFPNLSALNASRAFENLCFTLRAEPFGGPTSEAFSNASQCLITLTSVGISYDMAIERAMEIASDPGKIASIDFSKTNFSTEVCFKSSDYSIERAEQQFGGIAGDFKRLSKLIDVGTGRDALHVATYPSVTIGSGQEGKKIVGVSEGKEASARADTIMQSLEKLCGGKNEQYRLCLWLLTQSSPLEAAMKGASYFIGGSMLDEHTPLDYTITKNEAGDITVSMKLPEGRGYNAEATHIIHTDGTTETTKFVFEHAPLALTQVPHLIASFDGVGRIQNSTLTFLQNLAMKRLESDTQAMDPEASAKQLKTELRQMQSQMKSIVEAIEGQGLSAEQTNKAIDRALHYYATMVHQEGPSNAMMGRYLNDAIALGLQSLGLVSGTASPLRITHQGVLDSLKPLNLTPEQMGQKCLDEGKSGLLSSFFKEMGLNLDGSREPGSEGTQFQRDCNREKFFLPDGTQLSGDPMKARDQLSHFVTHGRKKDFTELNSAEKKQLGVLLSLLNQFSTSSHMNLSSAVNSKGSGEPIVVPVDSTTDEKHKNFYLSFDDANTLHVMNNKIEDPPTLICLPTIKEGTLNGGGSVFSSGLEVTIPEATMERIGQIDWASPTLGVHTNDGMAELQQYFQQLPEDIQALIPEIGFSAVHGFQSPDS